MNALGVLSPDYEPRATQHIPEMISLIESLIERGYAYESQGHVLFKEHALKLLLISKTLVTLFYGSHHFRIYLDGIVLGAEVVLGGT
eukprot:gene16043-16211_t